MNSLALGHVKPSVLLFTFWSWPNGYLNDLAETIKNLKQHIHLCQSCFRFFADDASKSSICTICRDDSRDQTSILIVSKDVDFENIERSNSFNGLYFILGGTVPILEKDPDKRIRTHELQTVIEKRAKSENLKEIILAMSLNPEGENTEEYVTSLLQPLIKKYNLKISLLGRGLSTGTELEYSDSETIKNALKNRA